MNGKGNDGEGRWKERWWATLAGAVLAAAFLGPGTITTASRAGASHGAALLWTLLLATLACFVLQDAAARLTIGSGMPLGAALRRRFGLRAAAVVALAVVIGCAAYEAGNILGGVAGARMVLDFGIVPLTVASSTLAFALLWVGRTGVVTTVLSALVATMGLAFLVTAVGLRPELGELLRGLAVPTMPAGAGLLLLGLVGTTVVPYNLFLGSGLAQEREGSASRFGLAVAIGLGGLVSMAVLVVGTAVVGDFGFDALAEVLADRLGGWAVTFFGLGLFAAGFTSAVTAPLAAAWTAQGLFSDEETKQAWSLRGRWFRVVWIVVLLTGTLFGVLGVQPIPVIILAQAANALVLPFVSVFLWAVTADRELVGEQAHGPVGRGLLAAVVLLTVALGARGAWGAIVSLLG
ncbi:MAG: divalent metal cation transporter [Thermoanaerobaculia bacterium]|nr:divalent metal cation transporter [Thermoanaerobaculia bacterium]